METITGNIGEKKELISGEITEIVEVISGDIIEQIEYISGEITEIEEKYIRKHKWASPYSYNGSALIGSFETDAVWKIVRLQIHQNGSVIEKKTVYNVKWSELLTLIF